MKELLITTLFTLLFLWLSGPANAQTDTLKHTLSIGLNFQTHGEVCGGGLPRASQSSENRSSFISGRTRIVADYRQNDWLQSHLVVQNSAIWGSKGNLAVNLYEGWVKATAPFGLFAQVGRIALSYDDERIIGPNDFANASRSHDALRVGYEGHGHKLHAIVAYNQNGDNVYYGTYYVGGAQPYKNMQTVWYHYDIPGFPLGASLLFMNMGLQAGVEGNANNAPRVEYQQMYGGHLRFHPRYVTVEASGYRQSGKHVND